MKIWKTIHGRRRILDLEIVKKKNDLDMGFGNSKAKKKTI